MAITRYQPRSFLGELQTELNRFFDNNPALYRDNEQGQAASDWMPSIDIKEDDKQFTIHADVPGVKAEDIEVTMANGILTIKGHRETEKKEEKENYRRVERSSGTFLRRFTMPDTVDAEGITAKTRDGVLDIRVPKASKAQPRKITVEQ